MLYQCAHCKILTEVEDDVWIDAGTQLDCQKCNKSTIVDLFTPEDYKASWRARFELREIRKRAEQTVLKEQV